jgi:hypothetical protein
MLLISLIYKAVDKSIENGVIRYISLITNILSSNLMKFCKFLR